MLTMNRYKLGQAIPTSKPFLSTLDIFKGLPFSALAELERKAVERRFAKGETIFLEGDPGENAWFVKEGHVKAQASTPHGRCQTLCMVGRNGLFGACCALGGGSYPCHSVAETEVTVVSIPMADFQSVLGRFPSAGMALISQLSRKLNRSKESQVFEQETVEKRILHVLVGLMEEFGDTIPLTRREIAEMAGTVVETCIRTFSKLEAAGLVACTRGRIVVRDAVGMKDRMREEE